MYIFSLALITAIDGVGGQHHAPAALPPRETDYLSYRRLVGTLGWSGQVRNNWRPPGFDPRTVQPVASRYTSPESLRCLLLLVIPTYGHNREVPLVLSLNRIYKSTNKK
jgi:hypothetical protein